MGRLKTKNRHLPPRMRMKGDRFYYVAMEKWTPLGGDYIQALMRWREMEGQSEGGETVSEMIENALVVMSKTIKPGTLREFSRARTKLAEEFAGFRPIDVKPKFIAQYLELRESKVAGNREIAFFSAAWEIARRRGWINLPNPCIGIRRNPEKSRKRVARPQEINALLALDCVQADMVELTLLTAIRESDMLNLTKNHLEDGGIRVKPRKTDASTEAELLFEWTPELRAVIDRANGRRRRVGSIYIFAVGKGKRSGQPYTVNSFQSLYHRYFAKCGVEKMTWHDLRRTALNLKEQQEGKEAAQRMAAHSSLVTTEGYLSGVGATKVRPVSLANTRSGYTLENKKAR